MSCRTGRWETWADVGMQLQSSTEALLYTANTDQANWCYFGLMLFFSFSFTFITTFQFPFSFPKTISVLVYASSASHYAVSPRMGIIPATTRLQNQCQTCLDY